MSGKVIELTREINGSASIVFEAIKNGVLFKSTGIDTKTFVHEFKVGGAYEFCWNVGGKCSGVYNKIVENELVEFSWKSEECKGKTSTETLVSVALNETNGKTKLTLVHSGLDQGFCFEDHLRGWTGSLDEFLKLLCVKSKVV